MKKSFKLLVLLMLILVVSFSNAQQKTKGIYKSCEMFNYKFKFGELDLESKFKVGAMTYENNGNQIEYTEYLNGSIGSKSTSKFDEKGNLLEQASYGSDNNIIQKSTNKYDLNNLTRCAIKQRVHILND